VSEPSSLWRHADFRRLWSAQAISAFGSRITRTALPIVAVNALGEPESIIGLLAAMQLAPGVVLALFAGGFVDRGRKRRILVAADLIRAAAVASLTVAWLLGVLSMAHVIVVGAVVGAASALFQISDVAYLPTLVGKPHLAEGNAKLEATEAIAEITGPASAGGLIAALGAPLAVAIDAASYVWSAFMLGRIRAVETAPPERAATPQLGSDLRIGLRAVFGHPQVRPIVLSWMVWSIVGGFFIALYPVFCLRVLHLSEAEFGVVIAMGGVGALGGAVVSRRLVAAIGLGKTLVISSALSLLSAVFIPLAAGPATGGVAAAVIGFLVAHQVLGDGFSVAFVIQAVTLRQTVLPKDVLGRANAAIHVCTQGVLPLAALVAGVLAERVGITTAWWIGISIGGLPPLLLLPLWKLREMPPAAS